MNRFLGSFGSTVGAGAVVLFVGIFSVMVLMASCSGDSPNRAEDTSSALSTLAANSSSEDVKVAIDDEVGNSSDARKIATAVNNAHSRGVSYTEIAGKLDELGDSDTQKVVSAINAMGKTATASTTATVTSTATKATAPAQATANAATAQPSTTSTGVKAASNGNRPKWLGSQCVVPPTIPAVKDPVKTTFTSSDSLAYPELKAADPTRSSADFPDDIVNGVNPWVGYDVSFQNGDYFQNCAGDTDVPQYYWRVETTGYFYIPKSDETPEDIVCMAEEHKGCALIYINHFGPTMKINGVYDDNGFTVAGPTWDLSKPENVTSTAQTLVDHYVYRMIYGDGVAIRNDAANCSVIEGCQSVEWHVVVYGKDKLKKHWTGLFTETTPIK